MEGGDLRMSTIDERVVSMKFDNKQFEDGTKQTMASLDALNKSLKLEGATKGLTDVSNAARNISLGNIEQGVNSIADRFKAMSVIAITALANITTHALQTGTALVKSLTIDPIKTGLSEYETNLNSIQTILSNTQWQNTGLNDVNKALAILNEYSDQTIYNFSEMARNIGTFTAAGVKLEVATQAIKGIANLAAISGSNSQQAATAMYQLSQALAAGKVALMDWNSVVNAGMGGKVFQDALMETARIHGVAIDKMVKDAGSFRNTLENGWLNGQILTETLAKFTGDLTEAQLKAMGYNQQQIAGILKMGKTAQEAATKVKTLSQLINTLQEAAGSGWAQTWQLIFGDFEEARTMFSNVGDVLGNYVKATADMRNEVLSDWKELGGRTAIIDSITNAFNAFISVAKPIRDAFRDIFPAVTGRQLYEISIAIRNFTQGLTISSEAADRLRRTFAGLFAILGIGWDLIKVVATTLARLFGITFEGSGNILEITAKIGDFLVALRLAIQQGEGFEKIFGAVGKAIEVPIKLIKILIGFLAGMFSQFDEAKAIDGITTFFSKFEPLTRLGELISKVWTNVISVLDDVAKDASGLGAKFAALFGDFGTYVYNAIQAIDFSDVLKGINTGLFGALILTLRNMFGRGGAGGLLHSITDSFNQLTDTMQTMQNTLRAATLLQIAAAIGILTISVKQLSTVDAGGLTRALTAITVMFAQLAGVLLLFEKMSGFAGLAKMPLVTGGLILLAVAINILTIAVKQMADLKWEELARGLTGVTVLLGALVAAVKLMPPAPGLIATSSALILLSGAVKILASAVGDLAGLSWEELAKGLIGVGAVLAGLTLFTKFAAVDKGGVLSGAGIVLLAAGIKILASAMKDFAGLSWEEIGKGLTAVAGGLVLIGAALILIPPTAPLSAAGVLIVALSLGMLADALEQMGGMSWSEIGKSLVVMAGALTLITAALVIISDAAPTALLSAGAIFVVALSLGMLTDALQKMGGMSWSEIGKALVTLAGALTIITLALIFTTGALPGALALLVVAGSLAILTPILQTLGKMSWGEIVKGLVALAGVFLILGIAGAVLTPVVPTLLGLGIAIALIGVGLAAAGVGILAFSVAVTALSISGAALVTTIIAIVAGLIGLIPALAEQIGLGLVAIAGVIGNAGPAILKAITTVLLALLQAIIDISPKLEEALLVLITLLANVIINGSPKLAEAAYKLLLAILTAIRNNIRQIVDVALEIVANFIKGLGDGLPKVLKAGAEFIIKFINGLADTIRNNSEELGKAGGNLATAIIEGMAKGLLSGASEVTKAAKNVAKNALKAAMDVLGISSPSKEFAWIGRMSDEGMAQGLDKYAKVVNASAANVGEGAMTTLRKTISGLGDGLSSNIDLQPTIRPVLDLTNIRKSADQIGAMFRTEPIVLDATVQKAREAGSGFQTNKDLADEAAGEDGGDSFTFNQYNTSPKALSDAEIYRQTKNQLSKAKEAVAP